jgi:hypothetical protein
MWMRMNVETQLNACYGNSCPTATNYLYFAHTRVYNFTVSYTFSLAATVFADCSGANALGYSQPDYAEINVTPYFSMTNYTDGEPAPYNLPNDYQTIFHLDTRDLQCGSSGTIDQTVKLTETVTTSALVYLYDNSGYQPAVGLQVSAYIVSTQTQNADAQVWTSATLNSPIAVINSLVVV